MSKKKPLEIRLAQGAGAGYSSAARDPVPDDAMPETSPSAEFLESVSASIRDALAVLDQHEASFNEVPAPTDDRELNYTVSLDRLTENLTGWQAMLGDMADRVRVAQDDLAALDADLRRSLDAFAAARKHLQGEAASGRST